MSDENDNGERPVLRAFSDGYHLQMQPDLFAQSLELARLSIELARLVRIKEKQDPRSAAAFLPEAVALVNEAALHAAYHPKIVSNEAMNKLSRRLNANRVPFDRLYGGKTIEASGGGFWTPGFKEAADPKGMNDAFRAHFQRMVGEGLKERVRVKDHPKMHSLRVWLAYELVKGRGSAAGAVSFLEGGHYGIRDADTEKHGIKFKVEMPGHYAIRAGVLEEAVAKIGQGYGMQWARRVVNEWRDLVATKAAKEAMLDWKENGIPPSDLKAFAESQARRYKFRGNRRKKVETTKKGKDHPEAKKKQSAVRKSAERSRGKRESS
jgi:hypothetical protein